MLADYLRLITGDLQRVGLQGPDKEAPTSHPIPRINNEPSRPTEGVRFCLSRRSAPLYRENLFELNKNGDHSGRHAGLFQATGGARRPTSRRLKRRPTDSAVQSVGFR